MAIFSLEELSESLASIFSAPIYKQIQRQTMRDIYSPERVRVVTEEEEGVFVPSLPVSIAWDLDLNAKYT